MEEKRKSKRFVLDAELIMERLDSSKNKTVPINVIDVSKSGLGFTCNEVLEMNSVYKIRLTIWTGDVLDAFVNVIRFDNSNGINTYGGVFIGMTDSDVSKINIYELFQDADV